MNSLKVQNLFKELEKLEGISDIIGTALVNRNGLLIASKFDIYNQEIDGIRYNVTYQLDNPNKGQYFIS